MATRSCSIMSMISPAQKTCGSWSRCSGSPLLRSGLPRVLPNDRSLAHLWRRHTVRDFRLCARVGQRVSQKRQFQRWLYRRHCLGWARDESGTRLQLKVGLQGYLRLGMGCEFEVHLEVMDDGSLTVHEYGGGAENIFMPKGSGAGQSASSSVDVAPVVAAMA